MTNLDHLRPAAIAAALLATSAIALAQVGAFPPSLRTIPAPEPPELMQFVQDRETAVKLGKALFWDISVGSDRMTACASCHGHAGVDPRTVNMVHPGANGLFEGGVAPGGAKREEFFPTTVFADPHSRHSARLRNIDDVVGSQGVLSRLFLDNDLKTAVEVCEDEPDPTFHDGDVSLRQVTGRNPPTVVNAVYNIRNFWDGRANPRFNGVNHLGAVDPTAKVWRHESDGTLNEVSISLHQASLASQAVGPVLSAVEMSCSGRTLPDLAARLLDQRALALQSVAATDATLGALAAPGGGLLVTYREMIESAFRPEWRGTLATPEGIPQIEANFSLFFGLAIQLYEATLVSDETRYDRWMEAGGPAGGAANTWLTPLEKRGLEIFHNTGENPNAPIGYCSACHSTSLFTSATWPEVSGPDPSGIELMPTALDAQFAEVVFADHAVDGDPTIRLLDFALDGALIELEQPEVAATKKEPGEPAVILASVTMPAVSKMACPSDFSQIETVLDEGILDGHFVVILRRRVLEGGDCGTALTLRVEGLHPGQYRVKVNGTVVSLATVMPDSAYDRGFYNIGVRPTAEDLGLGGDHGNGVPLSWTRRVQGGFPTPELDSSHIVIVPPELHTAVNGAFKTPGLRNIELTGPFMHNGGMSTLRQVMEFYNRGGDFHDENRSDLSPDMNTLSLTDEDIDAVIAFMKSLTDERVRDERAPFDHPELPLPNGATLPAVGAEGREANCLPVLRAFDEILAGAPLEGDCDGDGRLDACMIAHDASLDANGNGVLDSCDCHGDVTGDGRVDGGDLSAVLAAWGLTGDGLASDLDGNGVVDGADLVGVLAAWGKCG